MSNLDFEPRDYQIEGCEHILRYKKCLIPLPGGTGKSYIPMRASQEANIQTIVILCSGNALFTWVKNINMHRPDLAPHMVVLDKTDKRKRTWSSAEYVFQKSSSPAVFNDPRYKVVIAKALSFQYDWPKINCAPQMLILDEPQKYLRKKDSKTYKAISEFAQSVPYVVTLSGSALSKGRQNFWPMLHMFNPKKFASFWRFVNQFVITERSTFGTIFKGPKEHIKFRETTQGEIFRPSTELGGLPPVIRDTLPTQMMPQQERFYYQLNEDMYAYLTSGDLLVTSNTLSKITRLRQVLCCPKILDPEFPEYGAGIELTLDHMDEEAERQHCVWATPFTQAIPYMQEALRSRGYNKTVVFRHGMTTQDLMECEKYYRENPDCIAICSIQFAQSYELETGNPVYFNGYDFDSENNKQMEWRIRRLTTERGFCNSYYIHNLGTYDDTLLNILSTNTTNTKFDYNDMHALRTAFRPPK